MITIGKKLLTRSNIESLLTQELVFYVEPDMILTSGAEDVLRNRGYAIHFGNNPKASTAMASEVKLDTRKEVERILEKEYNIDNQKILDVIVDRIIKRL